MKRLEITIKAIKPVFIKPTKSVFISLLVTKGDTRLMGKVLNLEQIEEYLYYCSDLDIEIIDTENSINTIKNYPDKREKEFNKLLLFTQSFIDSLAFIESVEIV